MLRKILGTAAFAVTVAAVAPAFADTITLKNGRELYGKVVEEKKDHVMFKVPQGTLKVLKRDIATFNEDDNSGTGYFGKPRPDPVKEEPTGTKPPEGSGGDLTAEEKAEIAKLRKQLEEELKKLGKTAEERMKAAQLSAEESAIVDACVGNMRSRKGSRNLVAQNGLQEISALTPKSKGVKVLVELLTDDMVVMKKHAAKGLADAGADAEGKWMAFKLQAPEKLLAILESQGDEASGRARESANQALESLTGKSVGWQQSEENFRTQAEVEAAAKWRPLVNEAVAVWNTAEEKAEKARKKAADKLKLLDGPNWRDAFVDEDEKKDEGNKPKDGDIRKPN